MATIRRFEDLEIWKKARSLSKMIYSFTRQTSFSRDFALRDQIRSAAISVMSNIAEGFERDGNKEFVQFLAIAKGSVGEVRSQLFIALDAEYITQEEFNVTAQLSIELGRMIAGFMRYLRQSEIRGQRYKEETANDSSN